MRTKNTLLLTVLSALIAFAASSRAEVITKGGASLLMPKRTVVTEQNKPMPCSKCTSDFYTAEVRTFKGTRPESVIIEKHRCEACSTRIETQGFGKAKKDVAVHVCTMNETKNCCLASAK